MQSPAMSKAQRERFPVLKKTSVLSFSSKWLSLALPLTVGVLLTGVSPMFTGSPLQLAVIGLALALATTTLLLIARWLTQVRIDRSQQANERNRRLEAYYEQRREKALLREIRAKSATAHRRTIWRGIR